MNKIFRIYLSHAIRGKAGLRATQEEINKNIAIASYIGEQLKAYFLDWEKMEGFPKIDLYVPADHDEFTQIAYNKKYITEEQILDVDCDIISKRDMIIAYGNYKASRGMKIELEFAHKNGISTTIISSLSEESIQGLKLVLRLLFIADGWLEEE